MQLRTVVGVPCVGSVPGGPLSAMLAPAAAAGEQGDGAAEGAAAEGGAAELVLVLYSRQALVQSEAIRLFLRLAGSTASALSNLPPAAVAYDGGADDADAEGGGGGAGASSYVSTPQGMANASSWLLRVMAHALDADVAEQWRVLHTATTAGSQLTLFAQQILATEAAQSDAQLVRVVGPHSTLAHTFSTQLCHATLYAAKAVWCNPAEGENLEGIGMPMRTSVGVPFCCGGGGVSIFVAYLQRRVEEDGPRLAFLAQLQLLAASLEDLARSTAPPETAMFEVIAADCAPGSGSGSG